MTVTSQQARIVLSTADSDEEANHIAYALVDKRLAACISLIPNVKSIYRWQGSVESASEILLIIKTSVDKLDELEAALHSLHSYAIPELLVLGIESGSQTYLQWLFENLDSGA